MIPQHAPAHEEQASSIAQMIAAVCDALRDAGSPRGQAQSPAGAVVDPFELDARLRRIRTRLDRIEARVGALETELAVLRRLAARP